MGTIVDTFKMMYGIALACLLSVALAAPFNSELDTYWETFKQTYNKNYDEMHEVIRRSVWEKNLKYIRQHNLESDMGQHGFTLGVNEYTDLTSESV